MAINIKNERTVSLARDLAERRGTTITAAITAALEASLARVEQYDDAERVVRARRHMAYLKELNTGAEPFDRRAADDDIYDEWGLPK